MLVVGLAACAALVGCGDAKHQSTRPAASDAKQQSTRPTTPAAAHLRTVSEGAAKTACERAVYAAHGLTASAQREIAGLCWRINDVVEDNEATVHGICQEVANASSLSTADRARASAACYSAGLKR